MMLPDSDASKDLCIGLNNLISRINCQDKLYSIHFCLFWPSFRLKYASVALIIIRSLQFWTFLFEDLHLAKFCFFPADFSNLFVGGSFGNNSKKTAFLSSAAKPVIALFRFVMVKKFLFFHKRLFLSPKNVFFSMRKMEMWISFRVLVIGAFPSKSKNFFVLTIKCN